MAGWLSFFDLVVIVKRSAVALIEDENHAFALQQLELLLVCQRVAFLRCGPVLKVFSSV